MSKDRESAQISELRLLIGTQEKQIAHLEELEETPAIDTILAAMWTVLARHYEKLAELEARTRNVG